MAPKISVITPCYNRAEFIIEAVESVLAQGYSAFEHIIVDGGSTDGTVETLSSYSHLLTIVESDHGIYDALNKGINLAKGEIIGLLNSDDLYESGVFTDVSEIFAKCSQADVVIGGSAFFDDGYSVHTLYPRPQAEILPDQLIFGVPAINAWFFRREVFERIGVFDQNFSIGADRDFLLRLFIKGFTPAYTDKIYYSYRRHSGSLTINQDLDAQERILLENRRLAQKYLSIVNNQRILHKKIKKWHDLTSIELLILFVRQKRLRDLANAIRMAVRHNWAWLFVVVWQSPSRLWNYWKKTYGSTR